jgi:hypothetical protein
MSATGTGTAVPWTGNFCETLFTDVSSALVTGGAINTGASWLTDYITSAPVFGFSGGEIKTAHTTGLNLAGGSGFTSRLHVVQLHTTGTDVSPLLQNLTVEVLN